MFNYLLYLLAVIFQELQNDIGHSCKQVLMMSTLY